MTSPISRQRVGASGPHQGRVPGACRTARQGLKPLDPAVGSLRIGRRTTHTGSTIRWDHPFPAGVDAFSGEPCHARGFTTPLATELSPRGVSVERAADGVHLILDTLHRGGHRCRRASDGRGATPARRRGCVTPLGSSAGKVRFVDMARLGRNPARIIPGWQQFLTGARR